MKELSVVIPTLWKVKDITIDLLNHLEKSYSVREIILIDNSTTPPNLERYTKLIHIKEYKNTYYCPAVNKGVSLSTCDNLAICNDDLVVTELNHQVVLDFLSEDVGMIGLMNFSNGYKYNPREDIRIVPLKQRTYAYACLYYIHKSNWIPFPKELKIFYGDDYQFKYIDKQHYGIINPALKGVVSATAEDSAFSAVVNSDSRQYNNFL